MPEADPPPADNTALAGTRLPAGRQGIHVDPSFRWNDIVTRIRYTNTMSVNDVQKLREATGAGVMECKKALIEAAGDFDKAKALIHERGLVKMEKRALRETGAGLIESYVHNERIGVLLDIRAETDFVVRSDPFRALAHELVLQVSAMDPADTDELLKQPYIKDESKTVGDLVKDVSARTGENIRINKFFRLEV